MLEKAVGRSITYCTPNPFVTGVLDSVTAALDSMILCLRSTKTSARISQTSSAVRGEGEDAVQEQAVGGSITYCTLDPFLTGILDPTPAALDSVILYLRGTQTSALYFTSIVDDGRGGGHHHIPHPRILLHSDP